MDCYAEMGGAAIRASEAQKPNYLGHMQVANAAMLPNLLLTPGVTLEAAPPVGIDGTECPALVATFPGTGPSTFVFDPGTKHVRRYTFLMSDEGTGETVSGQVDLSDWRDVGGITVAHQNSMTMGTESMNETVKSVTWNPSIPEGLLAAPEVAEIKVMVRDVPETMVAVHVYEGPWDQVPAGIEKTMAWITANGGRVAGPVSLIYRTMTEMKTGIQIPVEMAVRKELREGEVRLMKQPAFRFAYAVHQGKVHECWVLFDPVLAAIPGLGCTKSGPMRVMYMAKPDAEMNCTAQVGVPVRGGEVTEMEDADEAGDEDEPGDMDEGEGEEEDEGEGGEEDEEEEEPQGTSGPA
jgi:effector-binding domain-containing protein